MTLDRLLFDMMADLYLPGVDNSQTNSSVGNVQQETENYWQFFKPS